MKNLRLLIVLLLVFGFFTTQAQFIKFGLKGGANFPSLNSSDDAFSFNSNVGWHAGGMVEVNIPIVKVGADFLYSQTTYDATTPDYPNATDLKTSTFDIPVWGKFTFLKIITIHAGPQFSFVTNVKLNGDDIKDAVDESVVRFIAGAGVQLGPIDIHGRFIFPTTTTWQNSPEEFKNSNIQLSIGYWFGGGKK